MPSSLQELGTANKIVDTKTYVTVQHMMMKMMVMTQYDTTIHEVLSKHGQKGTISICHTSKPDAHPCDHYSQDLRTSDK